MDEAFRQFEWPVFRDYRWNDWLDQRGRRIVIPSKDLLGLDSPSGVEYTWQFLHKKKQLTGPVLSSEGHLDTQRRYSPMSREHATLFQTFAALDYQNLDAILGFASQYGLLGLTPQTQSFLLDDPTTGEQRYYVCGGESHIDWAREICLIREALQLSRVRTPAEDVERRANWNRVGLEPPDEEDRRKLKWLFDSHLQFVQGRFMVDEKAQPRLSFAPLTLLAAMWLQLALAVAGDKEFRACKHCRRLFEISTEQSGFRRHREFCSESCKTKDYRKRRRTALKLASQGKNLTSISADSSTDRATVRRWMTAEKKPKGRK